MQWYRLGPFQSTPPARAATPSHCQLPLAISVSIHAAREGGDPASFIACAKISSFQSTPPARAATNTRTRSIVAPYVSIHAAREGGDATSLPLVASANSFNPRRPRGRRPMHTAGESLSRAFQSTPPARAATIGGEHGAAF